jgi:hypothetical protein
MIKRYWYILVFVLASLIVAYDTFREIPAGAGEPPMVNEIINITHIEYVYTGITQDRIVPVPTDEPAPFQSLDELRQYVKGALQSHVILDGICVDYAEMLWQTAYNDRRNIGIYGIYTISASGESALHHWMNFAKVGNYIYQIEPQTGNVWMLQGWTEARVRKP